MLILKVISRLLDYPTAELFRAADEIIEVVEQTEEINQQQRNQLIQFIDVLTNKDLFDAQERFDLLFDRGRALSLLLFEHVHGESRDRGQAMVDLMNVYKTKGFEVEAAQLPDYIPLFLEFLSEQDKPYVQEWLGDVCHILMMLSERLIDRDCDYSILFDCLIEISGHEVDREEIAESVRQEKRDDTIEAIDKEWEDKEIRFDEPAAGQCSSASIRNSASSLDPDAVQQVPITWHDDFINKRSNNNATETAGM
ncbi:nitrate reductase molybdenum cofactor assembly chaperone [Aliikangiella coralliicola]|uniref:Nitrate reductase molybdenum cofactor assembly chaperone n=1 Tax=Aliikangiella coralliicola TaxID=2592383 RepID=A0A545UHW5_9GAMM|nr:nitrate reductase molybdenum cofactor assembly chaperone [Aliikangiella coralliicola]TQV89060.1 nitrate reductase molybdenum cofactor assembly chaperone [Aliikangiella coralliicola]